jgi:hypothetical protein
LPTSGKLATRALTSEGYIKLAQLTEFAESEILKLHSVGPKAVRKLSETLIEKGLELFCTCNFPEILHALKVIMVRSSSSSCNSLMPWE